MAHPHNRATVPEYDYGPPTTVGEGPDDSGVPQDNSDAVVVDNEGDSPLAPPPDAGTVTPPGGDPTDEVEAAHTPSVTSLNPTTAVTGTDLDVVVSGTRFNSETVATFDGNDVITSVQGDTQLTATLPVSSAPVGDHQVGVRTNNLAGSTATFTVTAAEE